VSAPTVVLPIPPEVKPVHRVWVLEGDDVPSIEITGAGLDRRVLCRDCCEGTSGDFGVCLAWALAHATPGDPAQCPEQTGLSW